MPSPTDTSLNFCDCLSVDAKHLADFSSGFNASKMSNLVHIMLRKFRRSLFLSPRCGLMQNFVRFILNRRCPSQVLSGAAGGGSISAGVRGVVFRSGRGTMNFLAHRAVDLLTAPIEPNPTISMVASSEGPYKAIISFVTKDNVLEKRDGFPSQFHADQRVTVSLPARVMRIAPPTRHGWLAAILNGAYRGFSHSSLLHRFVSVRARRRMPVLRRARYFYHLSLVGAIG